MTRKSLIIDGKSVALYEQNPFKINLQSPDDKKDKLTIKGLPISVSNDEVVNLLKSKGITLATQVKFANIRDDNGSLTSYRNGDRFVYCQPFSPSIPRQQKICGFYCTVLHHGKDGFACKSCNQLGHKAGDVSCPGKAEEGSILAFRSYEHILSNHFMTPIQAFGFDDAFKSVEHAFFFKMAKDLKRDELADKIKNAAHAGIVKRLSKEMEERDRIAWEDDHMDVMKELLREKAKTCEQFRNCLIMNKDTILAEGTGNTRWGTGLSTWVTEITKPTYWPGHNFLGTMLMELTDELMSGSLHMEVNEGSDLNESDNEEEEELESQGQGQGQGHQGINAKQKTPTNAPPARSATSYIETGRKLIKVMRKKKEEIKEKKDKKDKKDKESVQSKESQHSVAKPNHDKTPNKSTNNDKNNKPSSIPSSQNEENSAAKITPTRMKVPDIRDYYNPITGKRKQTDTTPEKNSNEKKSNSKT